MPWTCLVRSANARHGAGPGSTRRSPSPRPPAPTTRPWTRSGRIDRDRRTGRRGAATTCRRQSAAPPRRGTGQPGGCLVTAPRARLRPARTTANSKRACMAALRAALHKHVGESMRQTRTVCPGAVTGTRRSTIQGDGKGWPEPAHARLSAEDRFCGAAVARITMIRRRLVTCLAASLVVARLPAGNFSSGLTGRARLGALPSRPVPAHLRRENYPRAGYDGSIWPHHDTRLPMIRAGPLQGVQVVPTQAVLATRAPYLHHRLHRRTRPHRRRCPHQ